MNLVTCCPKCDSRFLIESDQLSEHDGLVRCGVCSHIFDGFTALENKLPTLTQRLPPEANPFANMPDLDLDSDWDDDRGLRLAAQQSTQPAAEHVALDPDDEPAVIRQRLATAESVQPDASTEAGQADPVASASKGGTKHVLLWVLGSLIAIMLACGQLVYIFRDDIAMHVPVLRPTIEAWCARLSCEVSVLPLPSYSTLLSLRP